MMRVLIIGAGDVAKRLLPLLTPRCQVYAVLRNAGEISWWRERGAIPLLADLDKPESLHRIAGLLRVVNQVIYLAPPAETTGRNAASDQRVRRLRATLVASDRPGILTQRWVYISTTGVYGDLGGGWADETVPCCPQSLRGLRRLDAERCLRRFSPVLPRRTMVLRVPGIYAADRLPIGRLEAGTPALIEEDDVFTNHIHANDLARIIMNTLRRGRNGRVYNAVDDSAIRMADYFDAVADAFALPRPRRISRVMAKTEISTGLLSFMSESRRLSNVRLKKELGFRFDYPTIHDGLRAARENL